jgi:hypothetical protein
VQFWAPEGGSRPVAGGPSAAVPLQATSSSCGSGSGSGASVGVVRCASGFPTLQN